MCKTESSLCPWEMGSFIAVLHCDFIENKYICMHASEILTRIKINYLLMLPFTFPVSFVLTLWLHVNDYCMC